MTATKSTISSSPRQVPGETTRVFLSYSRQDMAFVDRLEQALAERDIAVYLDRTEIEKGVDWWERICQLIGKSDTVVFVLSPDAAQSAVCAREVEYAVRLGKRLIPVVHRAVDNVEIPEALTRINYVFFTDRDPTGASITFEKGVDDLVRALLTDLAWLREHTRLGELARYWDSAGRPTDLLLRDRSLRVATDWLNRSLERDGRREPDESDLIHVFIQTSARGYYKLGLLSWRYRLIAFPLIVVASIAAVIGVLLLHWSDNLGPLSALRPKEDKDLLELGMLVALTLFILYVAASARRRYLIARRVNFFGEWRARWFALLTLVYNFAWLAAASGLLIALLG